MLEQLGIAELVPLLGLIFLVAALYSSVGHGGASGYLAVLSLFAFPAAQMSSTALLLNVLVSSLAFWSFWKAGHKPPGFWWLLLLVSVPASFVGGMLRISDTTYNFLLAFALLAAIVRMLTQDKLPGEAGLRTPGPWVLAGSGSAIGFLSGIVGVGGGIFLSPLAVLLRWGSIKSVATLSAVFILVNSLAGLAGRAVAGRLELTPALGLVTAGVAGGVLGSYLGSRRMPSVVLRRLLAMVLLIAALKLVMVNL